MKNAINSNSFILFLKDPSLVLHSLSHKLSIVISNSATNHHLYADDMLLLSIFSAVDLSHNMTHLEDTIANVSNWLSSNFLSHNPSKTEYPSLVYHNNSLNSIILPFIYLTISKISLIKKIAVICLSYLSCF